MFWVFVSYIMVDFIVFFCDVSENRICIVFYFGLINLGKNIFNKDSFKYVCKKCVFIYRLIVIK